MKKLLLLTILSVSLLFFAGPLFAQETASAADSPLLVEEAPPEETAEAEAPEETPPQDQFKVWKEMPWSLGGSFEYGMNTRKNFAYGYGVSLDRYLFTPYLSLGLRGNMHNDAVSVTAAEVLLNVRGYIPLKDNISLFAQVGFGYSFYSEEDRKRNSYATDMLAGCRFYITRSFLRGFYVEPYVRAGFPFLFSGGIAVGHWFNF